MEGTDLVDFPDFCHRQRPLSNIMLKSPAFKIKSPSVAQENLGKLYGFETILESTQALLVVHSSESGYSFPVELKCCLTLWEELRSLREEMHPVRTLSF